MRTKLVVALVVCTSLAAAAVGVLSYRATAERLRGEIDSSLDRAVDAAGGTLRQPRGGPGRRPLQAPPEVGLQLVLPDGTTTTGPDTPELPVAAADLRLADAARAGAQLYRDDELDGVPIRMVTESLGRSRGALQAARSLEETERVLAALRTRILWVAVVVAAVAGVVGWVIARQVTRRLGRVTAAAEEVASTGALDVVVPVEGSDESARLGGAFNEMMGALARSRAEQQRLVEDAGHELRTPMTSLRTNLFTLRRFDSLDAGARRQVLEDLESETEELSRLIDEVVEVATDRRGDEPFTEVDLTALASRVAGRASSRWERPVGVVPGDPVRIVARRESLDRAVRNLVENACKFDPSGGAVDLAVVATPGEGTTPAGASVEVLDRGPGIAPEDLDRVFDRFHRAVEVRSQPGSGLGLSIVAEVAAAHGGRVWARNRDGGGAAVGLWVPAAPTPPDSVPPDRAPPGSAPWDSVPPR